MSELLGVRARAVCAVGGGVVARVGGVYRQCTVFVISRGLNKRHAPMVV